jgi:uncharacterized protein YndB with AHSA1/START domain
MAQPGAAVQVSVTKSFAWPPEQVFDAWLDPAMLGRWMFGPALRDEEVVRIALDPRRGGRFSFVVRRKGREIVHVGEYLEMDRPQRLVFTWAVAPFDRVQGDPSRVVIDIAGRDGGCELTLVHELPPEWAHVAARAETEWRRELEALSRL